MSAQVKLLELAERGRKATAERVARELAEPATAPPRNEREHVVAAMIERYRRDNPAGSISRGCVCPQCDCAATKVGEHIDCSHCGRVSKRAGDNGVWLVVGQCLLADGSWPTSHDDVGDSSWRPKAGGK